MNRARSEAEKAFGDGTIFAEAYLVRARHIEVQILGDADGAVVVLGDRDCSLQRHRQKLVEIAPAGRLPDTVRGRLHDDPATLGREAAVIGLATVEFLVPADDPERFVFLQSNPRLQEEHTVTEEPRGPDPVRLQRRVPARAPRAALGRADAPPRRQGWAVRGRVNANTIPPAGAVLPAGGTISALST